MRLIEPVSEWKLLSCVWLCNTMDCIQSMEFSRPEILEWVAFPFSRGQTLVEPRSSTLQVDSLPAEPPGKPKNTGMGSLSLLQWIFLTQELNQGPLHCRWILDQLSCQGKPLLCLSPCIDFLLCPVAGIWGWIRYFLYQNCSYSKD